tara:strand:- start:2326 stop:2934 length:609 start_codon:yes stop_codon:yes gene_type:complete
MRTRIEIERRLGNETDVFVMDALKWVLEDNCAFCKHDKKKEYEISLKKQEITPEYLETKYSWSDGTVMHHMDAHIEYDEEEAEHIEEMRKESIDTLDRASNLFDRITVWMDELETLKDNTGGINSQWVSDVTKLVSQANASLKLIGQLKKEIGVDSQLLLAEARMVDMSRILVDVLGNHPQLLDQLEFKMALLKEPTYVYEE